MCGIVAYIGNKNALPILINGLRRLEYRGYDSAGAAIMEVGNQNSEIRTLMQLFAYHMAVALGRDVDRPRNLAKSVTVE